MDPVALYGQLPGFCGPGVAEELHQTTWCTEMTLRFITERRDGPWCLSVNPFDPHPPFDPPAEFLERYDPATLPLPLFRPSDLERQRAFRVHRPAVRRGGGIPRVTCRGWRPSRPTGWRRPTRRRPRSTAGS